MDNPTENLATHKVALNIVSDQTEHNMWLDRARTVQSQYDLSQEMKDYYQENNPLSSYTMVYSDLLGWALACVDWMEVAQTFIELAKE